MRLKNNKKKTFCSPLVRKLHLVVTAVREFIQAIDSYKLIPYLSPEDKVSRRDSLLPYLDEATDLIPVLL
jgi:hypothetical protein